MQTGEPGSEAAVTNSGTERDAVFDFVIPQGQTGTAGVLDVLATTDTPPRPGTANQPLTFRGNNLIAGTAITHEVGSADIVIHKTGIYQAYFNATVGVPSGVDIPASVSVTLRQNGTDIPGGVVSSGFTANGEFNSIAFSVPFSVTAVPSTITVVPEASGFIFSDLALTILRLGDAGATA